MGDTRHWYPSSRLWLIEGRSAGNAQSDHGRAYQSDDADVEANLNPDGWNDRYKSAAELCGVGWNSFFSGKGLGEGNGDEGQYQGNRH